MSRELDALSSPELMRWARRAMRARDFALAAACYARLAAREEGGDVLDLRMRQAFCEERAGREDVAIGIYRELIREYERREEPTAAAALRERIAGLGDEAAADDGVDAVDVEVEPLSEAELGEALFAIGRRRRLEKGEVLCREGDMPHALWLLESGAIEVGSEDEDEPLCVRRVGDGITLLGEIGYFTLQRRSADLTAAEASSVIEVAAADIARREAEDPAFAGAMRRLMRDKWLEPALSRHEIFARINDVDRRRLAEAFEPVELRPGEELVARGAVLDAAFLLQQGCLFYMHDDSDSVVAGVMPGDIVHLGGLLLDYQSPYRIVAATRSRALRLRALSFAPFLARRPWMRPAIEAFRARPAPLQLLRPDEPRPWHEGMNTMETMRSGAESLP